jgi:hypothetical protein
MLLLKNRGIILTQFGLHALFIVVRKTVEEIQPNEKCCSSKASVFKLLVELFRIGDGISGDRAPNHKLPFQRTNRLTGSDISELPE